MKLKENSRYARLLKPFYLRYYKFDALLDLIGYRMYTVRQGDIIEDLSTLFLGESSLDWILLGCNKVIDPFVDLEQGTALKIPSRTIIDEVNK